jgi:virulence factor Mce-like protein
MSARTPARRRLLALTGLLGLSSMAAGCGVFGGGGQKHFSAEFNRAIGVYVHSDVRVLGVRIGEVTKIEPKGDRVKIDMVYDSSFKVPADAKAVILSPSIVSDRYVQLTPVYSSGATLPDGAELSLESHRTAEPVELDTIYENIDTLNQALGPHGANKNGALSDLLKVGANNLRDNGKALNSTLTGLSRAVQTLSDSRTDLFTTIANLQAFTTTIAQNDSIVQQFDDDLAVVAAQLNGERTDLATAIKTLAAALGEVDSFVKENAANLTANIANLKTVTQVLVREKAALREFLDTAPTALSNLQLAYNSKSGTLDTRDNSNSAGGPVGALCNLLAIVQPGSAAACRNQLGGILPSGPKLTTSPSSYTTQRDLTMAGILS